MKAIRVHKFGGTDAMALKVPSPRKDMRSSG